MNRTPDTMRNLVVLLLAGFLVQLAAAEPVRYYKPSEIELITSEHRIVVKAASWEAARFKPGTIEVASINNSSQSRTAVLSEKYEILRDIRVVHDRLWVLGNKGGRIGGGEMLVYRLDTLELLDWVQCETEQELSPSGRFAVYQKHGRNKKWALEYPVTLLYDLWAKPERNRFDGKQVNRGSLASHAGRPIHPPDAAAAQTYVASATPSWTGTRPPTRDEEAQWIARLGRTYAKSYTWSEDERLVAFVIFHNLNAEDRSLEGMLLAVVELSSEGQPINYHEVEVPDNHLRSITAIEFIGPSIRLVGNGGYGFKKVTWIPHPQPWQR